uniref:Uncharacterized protein n=1 Tax=Arundo donax TaxID=35708 RepID=A0A0A9DDT0_ARUDO
MKQRNFHNRLAVTWLLHMEDHRLLSRSGSFYLESRSKDISAAELT